MILRRLQILPRSSCSQGERGGPEQCFEQGLKERKRRVGRHLSCMMTMGAARFGSAYIARGPSRMMPARQHMEVTSFLRSQRALLKASSALQHLPQGATPVRRRLPVFKGHWAARQACLCASVGGHGCRHSTVGLADTEARQITRTHFAAMPSEAYSRGSFLPMSGFDAVTCAQRMDFHRLPARAMYRSGGLSLGKEASRR